MRTTRRGTVAGYAAAVLAAAWLALAAGCGGDGEADACEPACNANDCKTCVDGVCQSICTGDNVCLEGDCVPPVGTCEPACEESLCLVCSPNDECVTTCSPDELCVAGDCQPIDDSCAPACVADDCTVCVAGQCVSTCTAGQTCQAGLCVADDTCTPACGEGLCLECQGGACVSTCTADEVCVAGVCETEGTCDPPCDVEQCQVCTDEGCVSACSPGQTCTGGGRCEVVCDPACDAQQCQACVGGECASTCDLGEVCDAGACVPDTSCDPGCDASQCMVCSDGECVSECTGEEVCTAGRCKVPGALTVFDLQDVTSADHPAVNTDVQLGPVVVTAIDRNGNGEGSFWVQEADGGPWSGIRVFNPDAETIDTSALQVGMRVTLAGIYVENFESSEVRLVSFEIPASAIVEPEPEVVAPADVATGGAEAEAYEGVLVRVAGVTVTNANPDDPADHGEFAVTGDLRVDDDLYRAIPDPAVGDAFASITGVMSYSFENTKLLPRSAEDLAPVTCPDDRDCDTVLDDDDNCPDDPNPQQEDEDENGVGDACEGGGALTIYDIQDDTRPGHPAVDTEVTLEGVVVTAIDDNGSTTGSFWVQDVAGGPFSGIRVYNAQGAIDVSELSVGARVDVVGTYKENFGNSELNLISVEVTALAATEPQPEVVAAADVATGGDLEEEYEGVLVQVEDVTITNANPAAPDDDFGEFEVTGGLLVDNDLYNEDRVLGANYDSLTGVMMYSFEERKLLPRRADDCVTVACEGDRDCDTVLDGADNCPDDPNEGQANGDADSHGDACDNCPDDTNEDQADADGDGTGDVCEGAPADGVSAVQQDPDSAQCDSFGESAGIYPPAGDDLAFSGLIVTTPLVYVSTNLRGYYLQDPDGGAWSGILAVFFRDDDPGLLPGDVVDANGDWQEYKCLTQLKIAVPVADNLVKTGTDDVPAPVTVDAAQLVSDADYAESHEGVLITVSDQTVAELPNDANHWQITMEGGLRLDDLASYHYEDYVLAVGQTFDSVTGVFFSDTFTEGGYLLAPRGAADFVPAAR